MVVMPTETVYGLAADAFQAQAVGQIFQAKGRPANHPLIVHIGSLGQLESVAIAIPSRALDLAQVFWPGPLTLVLPKHPSVPAEVTGGLDSVAVRMPNHQQALKLLTFAGTPVCAPSANRFTGLSPTRAHDVDPSLGAFAILDGGECQVGIESTVLDLTGDCPIVLRPGDIGAESLSAILGTEVSVSGEASPKSPGQHPRHYAPITPVFLVETLLPEQAGLTLGDPSNPDQIKMNGDPRQYARALYAALSALDRKSLSGIYIERPPQSGEWAAVWDRLQRATSRE